MYKDFYELDEKPFTLTPNPKFIYLSESHRVALEHLFYGITQKEGFILIAGEVGTGKTTICRVLLEKLEEKAKTVTALILNPQLSEEELLASILSEFGVESSSSGSGNNGKKVIIDKLNEFLLKQLSYDSIPVLIIDEAQNLSFPVMEQIRLLSNLETESEKLIQIVLMGQPELEDKLQQPALRQLNQRIPVRYSLVPLTSAETKKYIDHRLMVAGSDGNVHFSDNAVSHIYKYSRGIPRLINIIAERCLLGGYSNQTTLITHSISKEAVKSLGMKKLFQT